MEDQVFVTDYLAALHATLDGLETERIHEAILALRRARDEGRLVAVCGNGGSASIASQMVVDIVKGASYGKPKRFKMLALNESVATLTAYANDVAYEAVFVEQLKNWAQPGDVLIAISGSGNSPNVINAVEYANGLGMTTIGCTTADGGRLRDLATLPLLVPGTHMGRLEDGFFVITHILCYAFMEDRF